MESPATQGRDNPATPTPRSGGVLHPGTLIPALTGGALTALFHVILASSFAGLLFRGPLLLYVSRGLGLILIGSIITGLAIAIWGSQKGIIGGMQDIPASIMALVTANIAAAAAGLTATQLFVTAATAIALTTFLTGVVFFLLGYFRLTRLVRFLPYPVVGGFLASTGWLLTMGGLGLMTDLNVGLSSLGLLVGPEILLRWLPGLILGVLLILLPPKIGHPLALPGLLVAAGLLFYLVTWMVGSSFGELQVGGWLLGPFPAGRIWQPIHPLELSHIEWELIWPNAANIGAAVIMGAIALLLNITSLELIFHRDVDLNHEMKLTGAANLLGGLFFTLPGYHQIATSVINQRLGSRNRLPGVVAAALSLLVLLFGGSFLSFFPKVVLGGLLLTLGLSLLHEWVVLAWSRFSRLDYAIVIIILLVIATTGFLEGLIVGLIAAIILFVVNYSRVDIVHYSLSGNAIQSRVTRPTEERKILQQVGKRVFILRLQGYIFFGTAQVLIDRIQAWLKNLPDDRPFFFVVDFHLVTGLDSTARLCFAKIHQMVQAASAHLVLTEMSDPIKRLLVDAGLAEDGRIIHHFADLDHGLEWCEEQILVSSRLPAAAYPDLPRALALVLEDEAVEEEIRRVMACLERRELAPGERLIRQGEEADDLFFVEAGQVTAQVAEPGRDPVRLETMMSGRMVGELGFFLGSRRTADVLADTPTVVYRLTREALGRMERTDPEAAATLNQIMHRLQAERLVHLMQVLESSHS